MPAEKVTMILGTRPEAIKLAPVYIALRERGVDARICATGQHEQLAKDSLRAFDIYPYHELSVMRPNQSLTGLMARLLERLQIVLLSWKPDWVIVQGDTASALAGALAAYYAGIKIAHIEAGLRTGDLYTPYPEEGNRRMISEIATLNFAPTPLASKTLPNARVVGNTVVDALAMVPDRKPAFGGRYALVTAHRRESFGQAMEFICEAVRELARQNGARLLFSVHPNPNARRTVMDRLTGQDNVVLLQPVNYPDWINLLRNAWYVMTDSGGIQEEAPSFGVPVVVMRDQTERMEAVNYGFARLAGRTVDGIIEAASGINEWRASIAGLPNPFGDGKASERIADHLLSYEQ